MNQLASLFPIQFIEGINDSEEPTSGRFLTWGNYGIAIPYTPSITYSLAAIEIYGSPEQIPAPKEHTIRVYTDHKDNPSRTWIAEGKLVIPGTAGEQWLPIQLVQSVVIFAKRKYWLSIEDPLKFAIGIASEGEELSLRGYLKQQWVSSSSDRRHRCMLKFFGRVLPAN